MNESEQPSNSAPNQERKVLVTGATGFAGAVLTRRLVQDGARVRVLVRSREKLRAKNLSDVEAVEGSVDDPEAVGKAMEGIEVVYHLAAAYREGGLGDAGYRVVHVEGTRLLCRAAVEKGVKRFVHCSTVGVHGHIEHPPADETYRFSPGDIYQETKLEGEKCALGFHRENGLAVSVVRPAAILGPEDERLLKLFRLANRDRVILLGDGKIHYHLVHVEDLVQGFLLAGTVPEAVGQAFIIGADTSLELNDLVGLIAKILGKRGKILHLPVKPVQWLGTVCEKTLIPLGLNPPIYRRRVDFFTKSRSFSIQKARDVLGYSPRYSIEEGLRETAEGYRSAGWIQ